MLWIIPAWLISLIGTFLFGYYVSSLKRRIEVLEQVVKSKVDKKPEPEEPVSTLIDPTDPITEAIYEHDQLMKKINPNG